MTRSMSGVRRLTTATAAVVTALALTAAAAPAQAASRHHHDESEGTTTVVLDPTVVSTLVGLGVRPVRPSTLTAPGGAYQVTFPIVGDPEHGKVRHAGGLDFAKASGHDVKITSFVVDTRSGLLTAKARVDRHRVGRIAVFTLGPVKPLGSTTPACSGIAAGLSLTATAARALGVPAAAGLFIGDACVAPSPED